MKTIKRDMHSVLSNGLQKLAFAIDLHYVRMMFLRLWCRFVSFFLPLLLPLTAFSFGLGVTLPLVSLDRLLFFTETPSLLSILSGLWNEQEQLLAFVVAVFSLLFPAVKILLLHIVAYRGKASRSLALLGLASKWSMMDVLLVALVIFSAKTSGLAEASALPGLWFYGFATLGSALSALMVRR